MNKKIRTVYLATNYALYSTPKGRRTVFTTDPEIARGEGVLVESIELRSGVVNIRGSGWQFGVKEKGVPIGSGVLCVDYEPSQKDFAAPDSED